MKLIPVLAIIGVMLLVVAIGLGIHKNLTGFAVSEGGSTDNSDNTVQDNSNSDNEEIIVVNSTENETEEEESSGGGGGGGGGSSDPVPEEEICDFADNDLDGEVDEIGCANIYGIINDSDIGDALEGINISFYDDDVYDTYEDTGNYSLLVPKSVPDAITNSNGEYNVSILEGIYHMVLQGSNEKDFDIYANKSKGALKHDVELDEDRESDNFNAEGHILFSGKYEQNEENKYVCGDKMKFMMFGVNHENESETITFMIEDHSINHGVNGDEVYSGNISDEDESLTIPAGVKEHKVFEFEIPCEYNLGKHDIHVIWNDEKFHKIGNFFIVEDTTNPEINTDGVASGLPGENIEIGYAAWDNAEPGTVRAQELGILEGADETLTVLVDKDINEDSDKDTIEDNDADYEIDGGNLMSVNVTYNASGSYTARFTVMDGTGHTDSEDVDITVYISEDEADDIALPWYTLYGVTPISPWNGTIQDITTEFDRYHPMMEIGDEYITPGNGLSDSEAESLNANIYNGTSQPFVRAIYPSTAEEYNTTISSFFNYLKCTGKYSFSSGPACVL